MSCGVYQKYDDAWIIIHWDDYRFTSELAKAYNDTHGTDYSYASIVRHCKHKLGLTKERKSYNEKMENWLCEYYPKYGIAETTLKFNEKFNDNRSPDAIKTYCERALGLHVSPCVKSIHAFENRKKHRNGAHEIGDVVNRKGTLYRKIGIGGNKEDNYILLSDEVLGSPPIGNRVVYLDGDRTNCTKKNLMFASRSAMCLMSVYKLWSEHQEITRTGIMVCELQASIKEV